MNAGQPTLKKNTTQTRLGFWAVVFPGFRTKNRRQSIGPLELGSAESAARSQAVQAADRLNLRLKYHPSSRGLRFR